MKTKATIFMNKSLNNLRSVHALSYFTDPSNDFYTGTRVIHLWTDCSASKQAVTKLGKQIIKALELIPIGDTGILSKRYLQCWRAVKSNDPEKPDLVVYASSKFPKWLL